MVERTYKGTDTFSVLLQNWKLLSGSCLLVALVAGVVNFLFLPRWFESTAVVMPPREESGFSSLGMMLSRIPDLPGGIGRIASGMAGFSQSQYDFVVILNSRTVTDSLIEKFDLERVYKSDYRFEAREELKSHTEIDFPPEGHVIITVEAKEDSVLARDMTYEYFVQLNNILLDRTVFSTSNKRRFLEARLAETEEKLAVLEDSLKSFQEQKKVAVPAEQPSGIIELITLPVKGSLEILAMLQAERESRSIQLRVKQSLYRARHPDITILKKEIAELGRTIQRIESEIPGIALDFARLYRGVRIQEELFLLLSAQLEEARINEADDTPSAVLLDEPVIAEYKSRPKRLLNILITTAAAFILLSVFVVLGQRRRTDTMNI